MKKYKENDVVIVIAGKDKGKVGKVVKVNTKKSKVTVEGVNIIKKHMKPTQENAGGINEVTKEIDWSNVMHYDKKSKLASKVMCETKSDGTKVRVLKKNKKIKLD